MFLVGPSEGSEGGLASFRSSGSNVAFFRSRGSGVVSFRSRPLSDLVEVVWPLSLFNRQGVASFRSSRGVVATFRSSRIGGSLSGEGVAFVSFNGSGVA